MPYALESTVVVFVEATVVVFVEATVVVFVEATVAVGATVEEQDASITTNTAPHNNDRRKLKIRLSVHN